MDVNFTQNLAENTDKYFPHSDTRNNSVYNIDFFPICLFFCCLENNSFDLSLFGMPWWIALYFVFNDAFFRFRPPFVSSPVSNVTSIGNMVAN